MPFNSWRFFNTFKNTVSKVSSDKSLQASFQEIVNKLPQTSDLNEYVKLGGKKLISFQQSFQQIYNSSFTNSETEKQSKTWRKKTKISKSQPLDISNEISHILSLIDLASSENNVLEIIESLLTFLKEHPDIRNIAVKHGAIRVLLNKRTKFKLEKSSGPIREALAILGHVDSVPKRGIRILSMDGGGIRGVLVLEMLKKLEELTGQSTYDMFDFICGVSTGAILTFSIGVHFRRLQDIITRYEALSQEIFQQSTLWGTGNLMLTHAYYDTALWEKKLKDYLGTDILISTSRNVKTPKLCVVSAIVNQSQVQAYVFRNYTLPWKFQSYYLGSHEREVWQAARASAAAPTYFEEFKMGEFIHQDGGILVNNPAAIAVHEAKLLWPNTPIQCVVSFGTGRTVPHRAETRIKTPEIGSMGTSWTNKFYKILDSATDTEAVHVMLNDLLPPNVYYRFNPYLSEMVGMVETDQKKHEQLKRDALMYLRRNEDKFHEAAKSLMLKKTFDQKLKDKFNLQKEMFGF